MIVAADHEEIAAAVRAFGGDVQMTSPDCASGTDRVAEVARTLENVDIVVNVQGDEPELPGASIDLAIELLEQNPEMVMATLATPIRTRAVLDDPSCVKVVFDEIVEALSRGDRVELRGFGAFTVKHRAARQGRNPRTGKSVSVEEKFVPFFKTGKELRERLNRTKENH